jgi:molecular chaperone GrpE (heat shock protein)
MPEAMDIECPCCGAALKVDPETSSVIAVRKKQGPAKSFDELVDRVRTQKSQLDDKFARSVQQSRNQKEILEKKFEEARKRAAQTPDKRPPNPFDYD